jgi:hypothetical protein
MKSIIRYQDFHRYKEDRRLVMVIFDPKTWEVSLDSLRTIRTLHIEPKAKGIEYHGRLFDSFQFGQLAAEGDRQNESY